MNENNVIPSPGWILIKRNLPAAQTAAGVIIPETARSRHPGITPGEAAKAVVLAVNPNDRESAARAKDRVYTNDRWCRIPAPGESVFVLAQNDNLVPVVTDEYGQVTLQNGFEVPDTYLIKLTAVAGYVAKEQE